MNTLAVPRPNRASSLITVQRRVTTKGLPATLTFRKWVQASLPKQCKTAEITLRLVGSREMTALNWQWRRKNYPTNVLSFPLSAPGESTLTGDIVICADVVAEEARTQKKPLRAHWAHMVIHGILHLMGFDHENETDALSMESEEIRILASLGFKNPYQLSEDT